MSSCLSHCLSHTGGTKEFFLSCFSHSGSPSTDLSCGALWVCFLALPFFQGWTSHPLSNTPTFLLHPVRNVRDLYQIYQRCLSLQHCSLLFWLHLENSLLPLPMETLLINSALTLQGFTAFLAQLNPRGSCVEHRTSPSDLFLWKGNLTTIWSLNCLFFFFFLLLGSCYVHVFLVYYFLWWHTLFHWPCIITSSRAE